MLVLEKKKTFNFTLIAVVQLKKWRSMCQNNH